MRVVLGNRHAIVRTVDDDGTETTTPGPKGKQATVIDLSPDDTLVESYLAITGPRGAWAFHAAEGKTPAWVASDEPALAQLVSAHYGGLEIRDLQDPYDPATRDSGRTGGGGAGAAFLPTLVALPFVVLLLGLFYRASMALLKTNAGNDFIAQQLGGTPSATAIAKYTAITANTTAPAATDTTLTGEITTAGGGLIRKAGTYAHTTGAASYTITTVYTANGSDALPVTIGKRGTFDAASGGNLVFETLVTPTATLSAVGDQLTLTDTFNY